MQIGIAFQLVDDLLDIRGDERMGKPRGSDIYEENDVANYPRPDYSSWKSKSATC